MRLSRKPDAKQQKGRKAARRTAPKRRWRDSPLAQRALPLLPRAFLVAVVVGSAAWAWSDGLLGRMAKGTENVFWAATVHAGMAVADVTVEGRERSDTTRLLTALGVERGSPILAFDPHAARARVLALPWVSSAEVERRLPDQIHLQLQERRPLALWQRNGRLEVIDQHGEIITSARPGRFINLPLVVGEEAAEEAAELVAILESEPKLAERVVAAVWVSQRRWNLHLEGRVEVRLPEKGAAEAWRQFARLDREQGLLDRDVAMVDLRLGDRLVLRTVTGQLPKPPVRGGTDT